jgi:hypothetical protein
LYQQIKNKKKLIMGQYYIPIILSEYHEVKSWMYSHDYGSGLKLMEHSWLKNPFVQRFESLISPEGKYHKSNVVWAGDYANKEEHLDEDINLYSLCKDKNKEEMIDEVDTTEYRYIVNHTKKLFVDKTNLIDNDGWVVHPLPLLTSEGNGRGGGDYHAQNEEESNLVGSWARDVISVESELPDGFTELTISFSESW